MPAVHRYGNLSKTFFHYRAQEIPRIFSAAKSGLCDWRRVESACPSKTRFHRRVVQRANHEVFTGMSLRPRCELIVLIRYASLNFRPWNIRIQAFKNREG